MKMPMKPMPPKGMKKKPGKKGAKKAPAAWQQMSNDMLGKKC